MRRPLTFSFSISVQTILNFRESPHPRRAEEVTVAQTVQDEKDDGRAQYGRKKDSDLLSK
jgi:hypothetical protein